MKLFPDLQVFLGVYIVAKATDFTPEEWEILCALPFIVAGTSLAVIHPNALKAIKAALSIYPIVRDTSKHFPENECIQAIFTDKDEKSSEHNELIEKHRGNGKEAAIALRNDMCEQAIASLSQKSQPQESEEYRRWLLQIADETMHRGQSNGFLGLGKGRAEAEIAQARRDFAQVLQISEAKP
jgi:hypothetical protein